MKFEAMDNWEYSRDLDGLLYFAQRCYEMLFHYVIDNYKVPVMNSHTLIKEYIEVEKQVKANKTDAKHLPIILEELKNTINHDLALKEILGLSEIEFFNKTIGGSSDDQVLAKIKYFKDLFSDNNYYSWVKDILSKYIRQPKEKKAIDNLSKSLLSELIGNGYMPECIFYRVKKAFFEEKVDSFQSLDNFLQYFDFQKKSFNIYVAVSQDINIIRNSLENNKVFVSLMMVIMANCVMIAK